MADKINSEFNYRYLVKGHTPWEKIKTLKGFLVGRKEVEKVAQIRELEKEKDKKYLQHLIETNAPEYKILEKKIELLENEARSEDAMDVLERNKEEKEIIEKLLAELYEIAEPTRIPGYTDEQMFEVNAINEFTVETGKAIYAEIAATGRVSPQKLGHAMTNPYTLSALKKCGLIPKEVQYIEGNNDPLQIELRQTFFDKLPEFLDLELITHPNEVHPGLDSPKTIGTALENPEKQKAYPYAVKRK